MSGPVEATPGDILAVVQQVLNQQRDLVAEMHELRRTIAGMVDHQKELQGEISSLKDQLRRRISADGGTPSGGVPVQQSGAIPARVHREATETLAWLAASFYPPSGVPAAAVEQLLHEGAEVHHYLCRRAEGQEVPRPTLHTLIARGCVDAVGAVMRNDHMVDLTVVDDSGCTPLHLLCTACADPSAAQDMLCHIVARLLGYLKITADRTVVNWAQEDAVRHFDFISTAAAHGRLALFWEVVKSLPYFEDQLASGILLRTGVLVEDWDQLAEPDREVFRLFRKAISPAATDELIRLCEESDWKPACMPIRLCVAQGPNVAVQVRERGDTDHYPILSFYLRNGPMNIAEALLHSPAPIDFTIVHNGCTPLHYISYPWENTTREKTPEEVARLLRLAVHHMETHPEDTVDWGKQDSLMKDPISVAANCAHLCVWVRVLLHERKVKYFTRYSGKIRINAPLFHHDWARVGTADQQRFQLVKGFRD